MKNFLTLIALVSLTTLAARAGDDCGGCDTVKAATCDAAKAATCPITAKASVCADEAKAATCPLTAAASVCADEAKAGTCPDSAKLQTAKLKIKDLTCAAGSAKLQTALTTVNGVKENKVCTESQTATIKFDPAAVSKKQLLASLNKVGFTVAGQELTVKVNGLSCGVCSSKVDKALASLKGVSEKAVCHKSKNAVVLFDPNKVSEKEIFAAIDASGFKSVQE